MPADLLTRSLRAQKVQAFRHPLVAPPPLGFRGGLVLDRPHEHDSRLRHTRYWQPVDSYDEHACDYQLVSGQFTYAGPIYHHFGHFMSEMVHRILPSLGSDETRRWIFVGALNDTLLDDYARAPAFFKDVLSFFRIDPSAVRILTHDCLVEEILVAEQGSDFGGGPKPGYLDQLRQYWAERSETSRHAGRTARKMFVSRSDVVTGGIFLGEAYLARCLEREGFETFLPQNHALLEQMDAYRSAETVIFSEGSACHGTELLGQAMLGRCVLLSRRPDHLEIFSRVLRDRSEAFEVFAGNPALGSLVCVEGGSPLPHAGVSLFDIPRLLDFLRGNGIAALDDFSLAAYLEQAEQDFDAHVARNRRTRTLVSVDDVRAAADNLAAAKIALARA